MLKIIFFSFGLFIYNNFNYNLYKLYFISNYLLILLLMFLFNLNFEYDWILMILGLCLNKYCYILIMLILLILSLIFLMIYFYNYLKFLINILIMLLLILLLNMMSLELLMFYFYYEVSLLVTFLLVILWGYSYNRLMASYYLMFYTLFFSLPMLLIIFILINENYVSLFILMEMYDYIVNDIMLFFFMMGFMVKFPLFLFHSWLLMAHVEAPVIGSMILAAIILKLGIYGMIRLLKILGLNMIKYVMFIVVLSLFGTLIQSLICLQIIDMKILVAYSSIVHMNLLLSGLMTMLNSGLMGSYFLMISHGLCSSGLFYLVNIIYYQTNSRLMFINKGLISLMPSMTMIWFMFCSSNSSVPLSLSLFGEILLMVSIISWCKFMFFMLIFINMFSFMYSIYLFSYLNHGVSLFYLKLNNGLMIDYYLLMMHWIPLNLMFLILKYLL